MDNFESFINLKLRELKDKLREEKQNIESTGVPDNRLAEIIDHNYLLSSMLEVKNQELHEKNATIKRLRAKLDKVQKKARKTTRAKAKMEVEEDTMGSYTPSSTRSKKNKDAITQFNCELASLKKESRKRINEMELHKYHKMKIVNKNISKNLLTSKKSLKSKIKPKI